MLNHKDKYIHFQLYQQTEFQKFYTAQKKNAPEEQVLVNVLPKASLIQPVDVSGVINASHCLEMLEEDAENWYFITTHLIGNEIFIPVSDPQSAVKGIHTKHFLQLMTLIHTYDYLTPYYQSMLLKESQFVLHNDQLVSKEVFDLSFLPETLPEFAMIKTQLSALVAQAINLLKIYHPETYGAVNWHPLFEKAYTLSSISQIANFWSNEVQALSSRLQPEVLENLYGVTTEKTNGKVAASSHKNYNTLQRTEQLPPNRKNAAIVLTGIIALCLVVFSFAPTIIDYFNHLGTDQKVTDETSQGASDTSKSEAPVPADQNGDTGENTSSSEIEQLDPKNITFVSGLWAYDKSQFHTGDHSLKLTLNKSNTSGTVAFSNLNIKKNAALSLWMRSDSRGNVKATFSFFKGSKEIVTYSETLNFEAGEQWYLMNPISAISSEDLSKADTLRISFSGDVNTLWLDDLLFESFK